MPVGLEVAATTPIRAESLLDGVRTGVAVDEAVEEEDLTPRTGVTNDEVVDGPALLPFLNGVDEVEAVRRVVLMDGGGISGRLKFCTDFKTLPLFSWRIRMMEERFVPAISSCISLL